MHYAQINDKMKSYSLNHEIFIEKTICSVDSLFSLLVERVFFVFIFRLYSSNEIVFNGYTFMCRLDLFLKVCRLKKKRKL